MEKEKVEVLAAAEAERVSTCRRGKYVSLTNPMH